MLNIRFKGKYKNESQIMRGELPEGAIKFKEPVDINQVARKGLLVSSPLLLLMLAGGIIRLIPIFRSKSLTGDSVLSTLLADSLVLIVLMVVHEIIHAVCFPYEAEKEIWIYPAGGAMFVYCNAQTEKRKWIWMCFAPNFFLGILPYILGIILIGTIPDPIGFTLIFIGFIMTMSGIGDFLNIYNAIKQVEPGGMILNYGFHSFWLKKNR